MSEWPARPDKVGGRYSYPEAFLRAWELYPQRPYDPMLGAYRSFRATVMRGDDPEEMVSAAAHYAEYVRDRNTEPQYIKHMATFYGPSEPWREFVTPPEPVRKRNRVLT